MVRARRRQQGGGAGVRRCKLPRWAQAEAAGTGERGSTRHARRTRPRAQPNGCAPRASLAMRAIQGCGERLP